MHYSSTSEEGAPIQGTETRMISGSDLAPSVKAFLDLAETGSTIRIMSPVIDDPVAVAYIREARQRGVIIAILTTLVDRHGIKTKGWDNSQNIEKHDECIRELARCGCMLRSPDTTPHGKMMLAENGRSWFGSANLATTALHGKSIEAVINTTDHALAAHLNGYFKAIWKAARYRMIHQQGAIIVDETGSDPFAPSEPSEANGISVWCNGPGVPMALLGINRIFENAEQEIMLVAMSLYELDQVPGLYDALKAAMQRGVKVKALIRKDHFEKEERRGEYPDPGTRSLMECGMELIRLKSLHAKGFLVDDRWCGIQSANFNPYSLDWRRPECNIELVIAADCKHPLMTEYAQWMRSLLAQV